MKKNILSLGVLTVLITAFFQCIASASDSHGNEIYAIFKDDVVNGYIDPTLVNSGWLYAWEKKYVPNMETVPEGENVFLFSMVKGNEGEPIRTAVTGGAYPCVDVDNSALQFWFYPIRNEQKISIGLTCAGLDSENDMLVGKSAVYIPLDDYADCSDEATEKWQLVTIPLAHLRDYGVFDQFTDTQMTSFDWYRICGFYCASVNPGYAKTTYVAAFDDIKLIEYLDEPKNIKITETAENGCFTWTLPDDATGTVIYKDGIEIERLGAGDTKYIGNFGSYEIQSYNDDGMYSIKVPVEICPLQDLALNYSNTDSVSGAKIITDGDKSILLWNENGADYYYIVKNGKVIAKSTGNSVILDESENDGYCVKISGKTTAGSPVTVMLIDSTNESPYFEQVVSDNSGNFAFDFIAEKNPDDYQIVLNCSGKVMKESVSGKITSDYKWTSDGVSYSFETYSAYGVCAYKDGELSEPTSFKNAEKQISIADYMYVGNNGEGNKNYQTKDFQELNKIEKIAVTIQNFAKCRNAVLMMAVYDENNTLQKCTERSVLLNPGENAYTIRADILPFVSDSCTIKIMLWDTMDNVKPIADKLVINTEKQNIKICTAVVLPEEYQTVKGWGTEGEIPGVYGLKNWKEAKDALYRDLGINMTRMFFRTELKDENGDIIALNKENPVDVSVISNAINQGRFDFTSVDRSCVYLKTASEYGLTDYVASMEGPPKVMMEYKNVWWSGLEKRFTLREDCVDLYCDTILQTLKRIETNGVKRPKALSLQNEPESGLGEPTYLPEDYKKTIVVLRKLLNENGYGDVMLIGPETSCYASLWANVGDAFSEVDKEWADAMDVIAVHSYMGGTEERRDYRFKQFANVGTINENLKDKEKWQTEFSISNMHDLKPSKKHEMDAAQKEFQILSADVGWGGCSVWMHWVGYYPMYSPIADRTTHVSYAPDENGEFIYRTETLGYGRGGKFFKNKTYDMLSMIFNNAPAGSVVKRVQLSGNCEGIKNECSYIADVVAFENGDTSIVAVLNDSEKDLRFNYEGMKGSVAECYGILNGIDSVQKIAETTVNDGKVENIIIPADSIILVKTK